MWERWRGRRPANWDDLHLRSKLAASTSNADQVPAHDIYQGYVPLCVAVRVLQSQRSNTHVMYFLRQLSMLATIAANIKAQDAPIAPTMSLIYHMECDLGEPFNLGPVPSGQQRTVIPIIGGFFNGERVSGAKCYHVLEGLLICMQVKS